jgi:hypothetical protein
VVRLVHHPSDLRLGEDDIRRTRDGGRRDEGEAILAILFFELDLHITSIYYLGSLGKVPR